MMAFIAMPGTAAKIPKTPPVAIIEANRQQSRSYLQNVIHISLIFL